MTEIQLTETGNQENYRFVAPGFHAGRESKPKTPGVEAERYNEDFPDPSFFGH